MVNGLGVPMYGSYYAPAHTPFQLAGTQQTASVGVPGNAASNTNPQFRNQNLFAPAQLTTENAWNSLLSQIQSTVEQFGALFTPQSQAVPADQGQFGEEIQQLKTQLRGMISPEANELLDRIDALKVIDGGTGKQQGQIEQCNKILEGMLSPEAKQLLDKINALEKGEVLPAETAPPADAQPAALPAGAAAAPAKTKAKKPKKKPKGKPKGQPNSNPANPTPPASGRPKAPPGHVSVNTRYGWGIRPEKGGWIAV